MTYNLNRDRIYTPIERVGGGSLNPKPLNPLSLLQQGRAATQSAELSASLLRHLLDQGIRMRLSRVLGFGV